MKKKTTRMTITCSIEAYRKISELTPTQKPPETIRQILESLIYYKGNYYELLGMIGTKNKDKNW